jgi:tetratricopeptide (TPR) repeat protein
VTELAPSSAPAFFNLGTAYMRGGQLDEAMKALRRSIDLDSNYVAARINLGNILAAQGAVDEAIVHYRRALALEPDNAVVRDNLKRILALSEERSPS